MIKFDKVSKGYPKNVVALDNISFRIKAGEFISIVGRSGAGKSTLLRLITREEEPTSGVVYIEGIDVATIKPRNLPLLRKKNWGCVPRYKAAPKKNRL